MGGKKMTFTYTRVIGEHYDAKRDEYFYDEYDFDYSPTDGEVLDALADIVIANTNVETNKEELKFARELIKRMIVGEDLVDEWTKKFEDDLKDYFEEDAMDSERCN